jgi:hypothetical protein
MKRKVLTTFQLTEEMLLVQAKTVIYSMTNNPNFENPMPSTTELDALCLAYDNALIKAKQTKSFQDVEAKNISKSTLQNALTVMANYVNLMANGDVAKLESSGFELNKIAQKHGILDAPHAIHLSSNLEGQVDIRIDKVENAGGYLISYKASDEEIWQNILFSKTSGTVKDLKSVAKYEFKVAATSSAANKLHEYNYTQIASVVVQ